MTFCEEIKYARVSTRLEYDELTAVGGIDPCPSSCLTPHNTKLDTLTVLCRQYVQPSLLLCKYVHSIRRPTADPADQVLFEAKQVWQNMLLLYVLV